MSSLIPIIDHIVLDVRDRMEEAAAAYRASASSSPSVAITRLAR